MTQFDLGSLTSVRQAAQHFFTRWSNLDVLINNAAIVATPLGYAVDGYEGFRTGLVEDACYVENKRVNASSRVTHSNRQEILT